MNQSYTIGQYKDLGYLPEAMFNFIALSRMVSQGEHEIFSREEFIEIFDENVLVNHQLPSILRNYEENSVRRSRWNGDCSLKSHVVARSFSYWICMVSEIYILYHDQMSYMNEIVELSALFFRKISKWKWNASSSRRTVPTVLNAFVKEIRINGTSDEPSILQ